MTACPKCGDESGYVYFVRVEMFGAWGSPAESSGHTEGPATVSCFRCGHRVRRPDAEGRRERPA